MKKIFLMLLISLLIIPINVYAYSNKLILGGNNIGIEVKTKGILVIGLYKIDNKLVAEESGIKPGDYILSINNNTVNPISDFTKEINNDSDKQNIDITYLRKDKKYNSTLKIYSNSIASIFCGVQNAKATVNIYSNPTYYSGAFDGASTKTGSGITVNYSSTTTNIDAIIATKSSNSNVVKGSQLD